MPATPRFAVRSLSALLSLLMLADAPLMAAGDMSKGGPKAVALPGAPVAAQGKLPTAIPALGAAAIPNAVVQAAPLQVAPAQAASAQISQMTQKLAAAADSAGDLGKASDEAAKGLGVEGEKAVTGAASGDAAPVPAAPAAPKTLTQEQSQKLRALKQVVSIFTEHYAPVDWKKMGRDIDFIKNYQDIRAKVENDPAMTTTQFRRLLKGFVDGVQDYHVSIAFDATEAAKLPLTIVSAEGRYFIYEVDREKLPESQFPYKRGTEVVTFDGKPVADVVKSFLASPQNTAETDQRLAEMMLTGRSARKAMDVPPEGSKAVLGVKVVENGVESVKDVSVAWTYRKEMIPQDLPAGGEHLGPESVDPLGGELSMPPLRQGPTGLMAALRKKVRDFMAPMMQVHPDFSFMAEQSQTAGEHGFTLGGRKSFVPELGKVVWPATAREKAMVEKLPFHAYIYENEQGHKVGYVRISDYMAGGNTQGAAQVFAQLMGLFEKKTDALVIDQVNNPGGNMFYTYALLSMLSDKPLAIPQHLMMIDSRDGMMAAQIIQEAENPSVKKMLEKAMTEEMMGFMAMPNDENPVVKFAKYILARLKRVKDENNPKLYLTELIDLFGVKEIDPQPMVHYTKPITVLVNELDFSGGDFFPAILKDNGRATIFGVRTSGAGGAVKTDERGNRFGISLISYTWTLAMRTIGQVLENLGVTPDVHYQLKASDLQNDFADYKKAVNETVKNKIVSAKIAAPQGGAAAADEDSSSAAAPASAVGRFVLRSPQAMPPDIMAQVKMAIEQAGGKVLDMTPRMMLVEGERALFEELANALGWTLSEDTTVPRPGPARPKIDPDAPESKTGR